MESATFFRPSINSCTRSDDIHAVFLHDGDLFGGLFLAHFPAAHLGFLRRFQNRGLNIFVKFVKGALVHHDDIFRYPGLDIGEVLNEIPGLGVGAGGRRGDHCFDPAGGESLRNIRNFNLGRGGADGIGEFFKGGVIRSELDVL